VRRAASAKLRNNIIYGGVAAGLVVLPGAVRGRARVGPGLITVSWPMCDCPPAVAERGEYSGAGHLAVYCAASPGCRPVWYRPGASGGGSNCWR
jgi:hypothetical protein